MTTRTASLRDVSAMIDLAEEKRMQYQAYQPLFWRMADDSRAKQTPFFEHIVTNQERWIALVHETNGTVDGFLLAQIVPTPPVYNPGGSTCSIDDYWVSGGQDWAGAGGALLEAANLAARERGAVQTVVVCGHLDQAKRSMLAGDGYTMASEWYVKPL